MAVASPELMVASPPEELLADPSLLATELSSGGPARVGIFHGVRPFFRLTRASLFHTDPELNMDLPGSHDPVTGGPGGGGVIDTVPWRTSVPVARSCPALGAHVGEVAGQTARRARGLAPSRRWCQWHRSPAMLPPQASSTSSTPGRGADPSASRHRGWATRGPQCTRAGGGTSAGRWPWPVLASPHSPRRRRRSDQRGAPSWPRPGAWRRR